MTPEPCELANFTTSRMVIETKQRKSESDGRRRRRSSAEMECALRYNAGTRCGNKNVVAGISKQGNVLQEVQAKDLLEE
ncbi:uncharacterized protein LACBIDRAFT_311431 [Laccaria bicolor S238N-H82]|uniref:Predicted protein n=1 Tax=Laccaria bicolor (strain S238N-H82 / ATCC MYA-4686) TaxID=486041 RepID=B0CZZ4_LACBS|nr:uncharacterized protein LACBIDRAFT_311431 [Laccaria bicolor S238N-H82]EDR12238.1 predicted protein [Laccaria bicolor S238N-H82]|eukprot:XP_001876502.1 predicted protein [Laccaria bicolor S238N-H82]